MATKALISLSEAHLASVFVTVVVWCPPGGDCGGPGGRVMGCVWKQARLQAVSLWRPGGQRWGHRGQTSWTRLCLRYADDTTLMAESEEELKILLMKVNEKNEISGLKLNIPKNEDHGLWSHHFMANTWEKDGNSDRLYILKLQNHCIWWLLL